MNTLLADIDEGLGKTPYQTYTLAIGLDLIDVAIPLTRASSFEQALKEDTSPRADRLASARRIIQQHDGQIMKG